MVLLEAFTLLASVGIGAKIAKDTITDEVVKYEVNGDLKRNKKFIVNKHELENKRKLIYCRTNVPYDKDWNPTNLYNLKNSLNYLRRKGFTEEEVKWFEAMSEEKLNKGKKDRKESLKKEHEAYFQTWRKTKNKQCFVYQRKVYSQPHKNKEKMEKMMQNKLWRSIVQHYTYNEEDAMEYWTVVMPTTSIRVVDKYYEEVCKIEGIHYGF